MCRLLGVVATRPQSLAHHLRDAPHSLLRMSLRGKKAPHRDGLGWAYRDDRGRMRLHRWGARALAGREDLPGDLSPETTLLLAHARKASPEFGGLRGAVHAQPLTRDAILLAHNGTVRDAHVLGKTASTDSQALLDGLARAWRPRTPEALREALQSLLKLVRDYTALNVLLTDGEVLYALCLYTGDPDYYTLHLRRGGDAVVVASEPAPGEPGWAPLGNGELVVIAPNLTSASFQVEPGRFGSG
ncbi:MAG: class II glutamine amidotransferase [Candidatus Bipolaricaulota bacterium]|nr:class II glutamine amidotransferase [Candidatus Bipolaricaulota bacterium]